MKEPKEPLVNSLKPQLLRCSCSLKRINQRFLIPAKRTKAYASNDHRLDPRFKTTDYAA